MLTPARLHASLIALGYGWSKTQPNLIGIRTALNVPNVFNDVFVSVWTQPQMPNGLTLAEQQAFLNAFYYAGKNGLALKVDGSPGTNTNFAIEQYKATVGTERLQARAITTVPGAFYLINPLKGGCAVLVPGQYKNAYILGFHQNNQSHPALVQRGGEVRIYRDNDHDNKPEETATAESGYFGINIHRTGDKRISTQIDNWSAGCQVGPDKAKHDQMLAFCEQYRTSSGNKYTYTLLRERELLA